MTGGNPEPDLFSMQQDQDRDDDHSGNHMETGGYGAAKCSFPAKREREVRNEAEQQDYERDRDEGGHRPRAMPDKPGVQSRREQRRDHDKRDRPRVAAERLKCGRLGERLERQQLGEQHHNGRERAGNQPSLYPIGVAQWGIVRKLNGVICGHEAVSHWLPDQRPCRHHKIAGYRRAVFDFSRFYGALCPA